MEERSGVVEAEWWQTCRRYGEGVEEEEMEK